MQKRKLNSHAIMTSIFKFEIIVPVIFILFVSCQLMASPIIGMADNGDFERIITQAGLYQLPKLSYNDIYFNYINRYFIFGKSLDNYYISSQTILVKIAMLVNKIIHPNAKFDITILGYIYILIFGLGIYFICKATAKYNMAPWLRYLIVLLILMMFTDVGYTAYFNSFYGEPASYVFLFLTLGLLLNVLVDNPNIWLIVAYFIAALLLLSAKIENTLLGVIYFALSIRMLFIYKRKLCKIITLVGAILIIAGSLGIYSATPKEIRKQNLYDSVYYGILMNTPAPETDLRQLGVDPKYSFLRGTNAFSSTVDIYGKQFAQDFYSRVGTADVIKFYLLHPAHLLAELQIVSKAAVENRPDYIGNYEKSAGLPPVSISNRWSFWDAVKQRYLPQTIWFYLIYFCLYLLAVVYAHIRSDMKQVKLLAEFCGAIGIMTVIAFLVVLGDGEFGLVKHLFLFEVLFDISLLITITSGLAYSRKFPAMMSWIRSKQSAGGRQAADRNFA